VLVISCMSDYVTPNKPRELNAAGGIMATLQVRSIDDRLYAALSQRAAQDHRSISQEVIVILKQHLSQPDNSASATDRFLTLCGAWQDDREPADIAREIRADRRSGRRFTEAL
jgi:plasmid stability protein